jgi:hypothetical protein
VKTELTVLSKVEKKGHSKKLRKVLRAVTERIFKKGQKKETKTELTALSNEFKKIIEKGRSKK